MWCMRLKLVWMMSTIGTTNTPSFFKIREVTLQFLGDLTWNDPSDCCPHISKYLDITNSRSNLTDYLMQGFGKLKPDDRWRKYRSIFMKL